VSRFRLLCGHKRKGTLGSYLEQSGVHNRSANGAINKHIADKSARNGAEADQADTRFRTWKADGGRCGQTAGRK